jgi:hypothetical protein
LVEEEIVLGDQTEDPSAEGGVRYVSGAFRAKDGTGVFNLRSGSGLSEAQHKILRQLIHFIDEGPSEGFATGAYREMTGTIFPTAIIWWESAVKAKKIVEKLITWTGASPTTVAWKIYDTDGSTVLATVTDTITYSGIFETSRSRAIVVS